jgi:uncharacterized protein (DUF2336 family)
MKLLQEFDDATLQGSRESRERALWHATDVLLSGQYDEDQIWVFGEVIGRLARELEVVARSKLARRLAHSKNAPLSVVKELAFHDEISVAGPVLQHSARLDTDTIVANARTKGQPHLLAISKRSSLPPRVTDELVKRGSSAVLNSVASNDRARFSDFGFLQMIRRSKNDTILAENLCRREEIPRHLFQQLIAKASDDVRNRLAQERPELADVIRSEVSELTGTLLSKFGPATKSYFAAKRALLTQHRRGNLNEKSVQQYALSHGIEETAVALSFLSLLPVHVIERVLVDGKGEMTMILVKALDFAWETAMALLFLGAKDHRIPVGRLQQMNDDFARLDRISCIGVVQLYRSRRNAVESYVDR